MLCMVRLKRNFYVIYGIISFILFLCAGSFIFLSIPHITNKAHKTIVVNRVYFFDKIPAYLFIHMETNDALVANNPIDISVTTTNIDRSQIRGIQLTFEGAERYFPNYTALSPPSPPSSSEDYEEYFKKLEEYQKELKKELDKMREESGANILILHNDTNRNWTSFSGSLKNVIYSSGGIFDIGVTINKADGGIIGYEMGDRNFAIKNAIEISPPEVLIQLENANIMKSLGYIGVSIPFLIAGINALMEILKRHIFD